ncbi:hypothetical protein CAPTEDRAFT_219098 [Capitella teleta]|uniref:Uncharacterized protein n=1 Tax=Capitella teleta TaxID=283909 RepID=R7TFG6_CAPTE|nr:hypothetical protein CAPTEDRAFT_219098 [Capitella teleta]|eukprot:ELT92489.1 hypothetical protein CAPTEDRAFT_219098 [Capitella teleta]
MEILVRITRKGSCIAASPECSSKMKFRDFISNTLPRRSKRKGRPSPDSPVVTCNRSVVNSGGSSKDVSTATDPCVNINVFASDCCGHGQHADDLSLSDTESRGYSSDSNFNTIPRARSRIRTNPWLPSPKTSPPLSPLNTPGRYPDSRTLVQTPDSAMEISWSALSDSSSNDLLRNHRRTGHGSESDADSLLDQSVMSEDPVCELSAASPVSFEYEKALESTLEVPGVGRFVGSRDSLNWANRESGLLDDVMLSMRKRRTLPEDDELSDRHRASSEESGASSSTLCNYGIPEEESVEHRPLTEQKSLDSGFYSAHSVVEESTPDRKRSVQEIRSSLQAKVLRLRQEKRLVDEKIREAREEERMRIQHIAHFRRQVSSAKKYVLLETLDKLRDRLSSQSERLQGCYDAVLNRQQMLYRQQSA